MQSFEKRHNPVTVALQAIVRRPPLWFTIYSFNIAIIIYWPSGRYIIIIAKDILGLAANHILNFCMQSLFFINNY